MTTTRRRALGSLLLTLLLTLGLFTVGPAPRAEAVRWTCASNSPDSWRWTTTTYRTTSQAWCLKGRTGRAWTVWQSDGNLVMYKVTGDRVQAVWASGTNGRGRKLHFGKNGNFAIQDAAGRRIWSAATLRSSGTYGHPPFVQNHYAYVPHTLPRGYAYEAAMQTYSNSSEVEFSTLRREPTGAGLWILVVGR